MSLAPLRCLLSPCGRVGTAPANHGGIYCELLPLMGSHFNIFPLFFLPKQESMQVTFF